jgi:hypothetical protein
VLGDQHRHHQRGEHVEVERRELGDHRGHHQGAGSSLHMATSASRSSGTLVACGDP